MLSAEGRRLEISDQTHCIDAVATVYLRAFVHDRPASTIQNIDFNVLGRPPIIHRLGQMVNWSSSSRQRQSTGICYGTSITLTCGLILHSGT